MTLCLSLMRRKNCRIYSINYKTHVKNGDKCEENESYGY